MTKKQQTSREIALRCPDALTVLLSAANRLGDESCLYVNQIEARCDDCVFCGDYGAVHCFIKEIKHVIKPLIFKIRSSNRQRLSEMSNTDLAAFINKVLKNPCSICCYDSRERIMCGRSGSCETGIARWLSGEEGTI